MTLMPTRNTTQLAYPQPIKTMSKYHTTYTKFKFKKCVLHLTLKRNRSHRRMYAESDIKIKHAF